MHPFLYYLVQTNNISTRMACSAIIAYITCPSIKIAKIIAHQAVKQRLAACGNVIPGVTSIYEWNGFYNDCSLQTIILTNI